MKKVLGIIILLIAVITVFAHGEKKKDTIIVEQTEQELINHEHNKQLNDKSNHYVEQHDQRNKNIKAAFDDFPTLHPLVVHFPIVLLLFAAIMQLVSFFIYRSELSWMVMFFTIIGFAGAYIAGNYVHPHTSDLNEYAEKLLNEHEYYADLTIWLSGIAVVLKIISHFLFRKKIWSEIIVAFALIASAYCVNTAGHYGAQLIHIEGVGAKGKYLETNNHEH